MLFRIACTLFLIISVCAFPLFFTIGIGLFSVIWFRDYYELIPLYFLNDVLYGAPLHQYFSFSYVMTAIACVLVLLAVFVRRHVLDTRVQRL